MPPLDSPYIVISGLPTVGEQAIDFPSGVFGIPLQAHLSALNASFGFDQNPHRFELEYIPEQFSYETLPQIGSGVQFNIGEFLIQGRITHADFSKSAKGNVISVIVEDIRKDLSNFFLDTYGIFGTSDAPATNVIDVRYWYIKNFAETRAFGRSKIARDLDLLDRHGASYRQIYEAIKYFEEQLGTVNDLISKIPIPEVIEAQLPFDPDSYRWQFKAQPILEVLSKIMGDISYNFYWNMADKKINVINRKFAINIDRTKIPVPNDPAPILSLKYGQDEAERATSVRIYGAEMEGLVGVGRLKTESGAYDIAASGAIGHDIYDLGIITQGSIKGPPRFVPGWRNAKLKYFGPDGSIRIDRPTDKELKAALKGIEYWSMEKHLENRIDASTINQDIGPTTAVISRASASGIGFISNRGQPGREWVVEWYNRVRNFAQNHFARTYILSKDSALYDQLDEFDVVSAAWCNIENLTDDVSFEDNYKIKDKYRWLAPFWEHDANKMRGWASFVIFFGPAYSVVGPKWGADGKGTPGQFTSYNDEAGHQYVPVEFKKWDRAEDKFQEEFIKPVFEDEKGLMIRLPNTCWRRFDNGPDANLSNRPILRFFRRAYIGQTQIDMMSDPVAYGDIYEELTDVAIPIKVKRRYGTKWPSPWASGTGIDKEIQIIDGLAPWEYEPRGQKNSWELMEDEARSILASRVVNRNIVTFAEVTKLGLPIISFDGFANQDLTPDGYGIVNHGVTSLNITKNTGWWQTKYNIKSHFPQFVRIKPIEDRTEEDFEFVIRRLEARIPVTPIEPFLAGNFLDDMTEDGHGVFTKDNKTSITIAVTITDVFDPDTNPFYVGKDEKGVVWPAAFRDIGSLSTESLLFQERKALCIDGFLQVGMRAVYHYEDLEDGSFTHYFTGGVQLSASRIVELLEAPKLIDSIWRASVKTVSETVLDAEGNPINVQSFTIKNVPFLSQQSVDTTLETGDKIFMGSNGNENNIIKPNFDVSTGNENGVGKDSVHLINTGAPANVGAARVTQRPNVTTGLNGAIQTFSSGGGSSITDGQVIGGQKQNIRFIGVELDQISVGDPCITISEKEQGASAETRLFCFITKPTFSPFPASGPLFTG